MNKPPGRFYVLEGGDGCGKTTQAHLLSERLRADGREVFQTQEPYDPAIVSAIQVKKDPVEKLLLFALDRRRHVRDVIRPILSTPGVTIICDRYTISSVVYQAYLDGAPRALVQGLCDHTTDRLVPDATFFLDVPVDRAIRRIINRGDAKDLNHNAMVEYYNQIRFGYMEIAHLYASVERVDGDQAIENVTDALYRRVLEREI